MPRSRFHKLPPEKQRAMLDAAGEAFAAHGFEGASYNPIIEGAQVSKGAMYYYFEDKSDLFVATARDALAPLLAMDTTPPALESADAFWEAVQTFMEALWGALSQNPRGMALGRVALGATGEAGEAISLMIAGIGEVTTKWLRAGLEVGAVREDLPLELLSSMLLGLGQGFDTWMLSNMEGMEEAELERTLSALLPIFRGVVEPK